VVKRRMKRQVSITASGIDEANLQASRQASSAAGAVVCFAGLVRGLEGAAAIDGLDYETFQRMAEHQFDLLLDQMEQRWPIESVRLVHRVGFVKVNEASLWVEVVAPHRGEAFAACQWLIDEMKRVVPIWKKPAKERDGSG
jgi:molybdopterin synthase catalytic subunit